MSGNCRVECTKGRRTENEVRARAGSGRGDAHNLGVDVRVKCG